MKHFFSISLFGAFFLMLSSFSSAAEAYPIFELNNCRDQRECFLFCEIPKNHARCSAYAVKIQQNKVLGTSNSRMMKQEFPIIELGNCESQEACRIYCNKPQYQDACRAYAQNNNLPHTKDLKSIQVKIMTELGCPSIDVCRAVCTRPENRTNCQKVAKKYEMN